MKKKQYCIPSVKTHHIGVAHIVCASGDGVTKIGGNADINYGGGGSGPAQGRDTGGWDDEF